MKRYAIGFLAALIAILVLAASGHFDFKSVTTLAFLVGTAVVSYTWPLVGTTPGTTVPPTTASLLNFDSVRGTINFGDADTTATFTHNFGLSTTQLAELFPDVAFYPAVITTPAETAPTLITVALGTNALTFTKGAGTDTGGVWNVRVLRPHTIGQ
jgi:hypothetical protein